MFRFCFIMPTPGPMIEPSKNVCGMKLNHFIHCWMNKCFSREKNNSQERFMQNNFFFLIQSWIPIQKFAFEVCLIRFYPMSAEVVAQNCRDVDDMSSIPAKCFHYSTLSSILSCSNWRKLVLQTGLYWWISNGRGKALNIFNVDEKF